MVLCKLSTHGIYFCSSWRLFDLPSVKLRTPLAVVGLSADYAMHSLQVTVEYVDKLERSSAPPYSKISGKFHLCLASKLTWWSSGTLGEPARGLATSVFAGKGGRTKAIVLTRLQQCAEGTVQTTAWATYSLSGLSALLSFFFRKGTIGLIKYCTRLHAKQCTSHNAFHTQMTNLFLLRDDEPDRGGVIKCATDDKRPSALMATPRQTTDESGTSTPHPPWPICRSWHLNTTMPRFGALRKRISAIVTRLRAAM